MKYRAWAVRDAATLARVSGPYPDRRAALAGLLRIRAELAARDPPEAPALTCYRSTLKPKRNGK